MKTWRANAVRRQGGWVRARQPFVRLDNLASDNPLVRTTHSFEWVGRQIQRITCWGLALLLSGCYATATIQCPTNGVVTETLNAPDYISMVAQLVTLLGPFVGGTTVLGDPREATLNTTEPNSTLVVKTWDVGTQTYTCSRINNPATPVVAPTPAPSLRQQDEIVPVPPPAPLPMMSIIRG